MRLFRMLIRNLHKFLNDFYFPGRNFQKKCFLNIPLIFKGILHHFLNISVNAYSKTKYTFLIVFA